MCKTRLIPVLIGVILILSGCGLVASASRTTKNVYLALEAGDLDEALKSYSRMAKNDSSNREILIRSLRETSSLIKLHGGIDSITITKEENVPFTSDPPAGVNRGAGMAHVVGSVRFKDGTQISLDHLLVKEDGDWKIG